MSDIKPPKAVGTVDMAFFGGLTNLQCKLVPVKESAAASPKIICPECEDATKLEQRYLCPNDAAHGPYESSEAARGIEIDRILQKLTPEELADLKETTLETGQADFTAFPAHEVEKVTMPNGAVYRLRPVNAQKQYSALVDFLRGDAEQALIAEITIRNSQKMYRLVERDGMLMLTELVRPGELRPTEHVTVEYDAKMLAMFAAAFEDQEEEFDPEAFASITRERVKAIEEAKRDPNAEPAPAPKRTAKPKADEDDALMAALQASLSGKKAPTKRAPRKAAS